MEYLLGIALTSAFMIPLYESFNKSWNKKSKNQKDIDASTAKEIPSQSNRNREDSKSDKKDIGEESRKISEINTDGAKSSQSIEVKENPESNR
jgi:hypothetical protein